MDNESQIIRDYQQGNLEEFTKLYDFYIKKIYDFIYYRTQHRETAEDITSKTFIKALDNMDKFNPNSGTFKAWLYCIARNTVIDHYRTQKKDVDIDNVFNLANDEDMVRDVDAKMKIETIKEYMEKLKPQERDIIILRVWDQLSYKEISEVLNKSEASIKMMFSRTMIKLRQEMALVAFFIIVNILIF